ncbi:MAG: sulfatase-like hydrolase/transferase [Planctomycetota bacterium]|nr:sulfatase-like hydrolase/transferase [Planctomycetota bacterium]
MLRARAATDLVLAVLAGAGLGSLVHALLWPVAPGLTFFDVKLVLAFAGAAPLAFAGAGLGCLVAALRARRAGRAGAAAATGMRATAFNAALLIGVGALLGAWAFHLLQFHAGVRYGVIAALAAGIFVPIPAPSRSVTNALGGLVLIAFAALYAGLGFSERIDGARLKVPEELAPLPVAAEDMRVGVGPDVLLISVDTLRADDFLDAAVPTPHLDALRARGRWSDYARAPAPSTLPSHVTMMTGHHPLETGCYTNSGFMLAEPGATLAEVFREAGWRALAAVSNGVLDAHTGFTRGFEAFSNLETHGSMARATMTDLVLSTRRMAAFSLLMSDASCVAIGVQLARLRTNVPKDIHITYTTVAAPTVGDAALAYLDQLYAQQRPWFFFLHFIDPHLPYAPAEGSARTISAQSELPARYREFPRLTTLLANAVQGDLRSEDPVVRGDALAAVAHMRLVYGEELMAVDVQIGRVMERAARSDRPLIVLFTSDHGEHFGEFNEMGHGNTLYEEMLRVPFVLVGPGIEAGRFATRPLLEDVGMTLLRAAGIPAPSFGRGRDLMQATNGLQAPLIAAHEDLLAVLDGNYKAIFRWDTEDPRRSPLELLLLCDPEHESAGSAGLPPEAAAALLSLADEARQLAAHRAKRALSEQERDRLAELGYVFDSDGNLVQD